MTQDMPKQWTVCPEHGNVVCRVCFVECCECGVAAQVCACGTPAPGVDGRKVHGTGTVARSDGNDTDCGATSNDPDSLLVTDDPAKITCKRCLAIRDVGVLGEEPLVEPKLKATAEAWLEHVGTVDEEMLDLLRLLLDLVSTAAKVQNHDDLSRALKWAPAVTHPAWGRLRALRSSVALPERGVDWEANLAAALHDVIELIDLDALDAEDRETVEEAEREQASWLHHRRPTRYPKPRGPKALRSPS